MIERPDLTTEQRRYYTTEFHSLIEQSPEYVKKAWQERPYFEWMENEPVYQSGFEKNFHGKLADEFVKLENQRLTRTLPSESYKK